MADGRRMGEGVIGNDLPVAGRGFKGMLQRQRSIYRANRHKRYQGPNYVTFWNGHRRENRVGIFLRGGCDVVAAFAAENRIMERLNGTCCIYRSGMGATSSQSELILQTLQNISDEDTQETIDMLKLRPTYFKPVLFEENFTIQGLRGLERFPKSVVVLSIGPDFARTLYRHRQHGFLVDPGGWWLNQDMGRVLQDKESVLWFSRNFEKAGRLNAQEAIKKFAAVVELVRARTKAHILVFNMLAVEPGDRTANYQLVDSSNMLRRRQFNLTLYDLSQQMGFSIIDVDRILKMKGVEGQVDFAHWTLEQFTPIAEEFARILIEKGVLQG